MLFQPVALLTPGAEGWQPLFFEFVEDLLSIHSINLLLLLTDCFETSLL